MDGETDVKALPRKGQQAAGGGHGAQAPAPKGEAVRGSPWSGHPNRIDNKQQEKKIFENSGPFRKTTNTAQGSTSEPGLRSHLCCGIVWSVRAAQG